MDARTTGNYYYLRLPQGVRAFRWRPFLHQGVSYAVLPRVVSATDVEPPDIYLAPQGAIVVQATDAETGLPIPQVAAVRVQAGGEAEELGEAAYAREGDRRETAVGTDNGCVAIPSGVGLGTWYLSARGYALARATVPGSPEVLDGIVRTALARGGELAVYCAMPIHFPGLRIVVTCAAGTYYSLPVTTAALARGVLLSGIRGGQCTVSITGRVGSATDVVLLEQDAEVAPGCRTAVRLDRLSEGVVQIAASSVILLPSADAGDGRQHVVYLTGIDPESGVGRVRLGTSTDSSASGGVWATGLLPVGPYIVEIEPTGWYARVDLGAALDPVAVQVPRCIEVEVALQDHDGVPLRVEAQVVWNWIPAVELPEAEAFEPPQQVANRREGEEAIWGFRAPEGFVDVSASARGYVSAVKRFAVGADAVSDGWFIRLERAATLRVRVGLRLSGGGRGTVAVRSRSGIWERPLEDGSVTFDSLRSGSYDVSFRSEGSDKVGAAMTLELVQGESRVVTLE